MDHIVYQIFQKIVSISTLYVNEIETRITLKIKTGYYLECLMPEMMRGLGTTKSKVTKDKNCENTIHLEITETILVSCNIVNKKSFILCFQIYKYGLLTKILSSQR